MTCQNVNKSKALANPKRIWQCLVRQRYRSTAIFERASAITGNWYQWRCRRLALSLADITARHSMQLSNKPLLILTGHIILFKQAPVITRTLLTLALYGKKNAIDFHTTAHCSAAVERTSRGVTATFCHWRLALDQSDRVSGFECALRVIVTVMRRQYLSSRYVLQLLFAKSSGEKEILFTTVIFYEKLNNCSFIFTSLCQDMYFVT